MDLSLEGERDQLRLERKTKTRDCQGGAAAVKMQLWGERDV